MAEAQSEIDAQRTEITRLADAKQSLTQSLTESEVQRAAGAVVNNVLLHAVSVNSLRELEAQRAETAQHADAEFSLTQTVKDFEVQQAASVVVNTVILNAVAAEAQRGLEVQRAKIGQLEQQLQSTRSETSELTRKLVDFEVRQSAATVVSTSLIR